MSLGICSSLSLGGFGFGHHGTSRSRERLKKLPAVDSSRDTFYSIEKACLLTVDVIV